MASGNPDNNAQSWTQIGTYPKTVLIQITTISGDPNNYGQVYVGFAGSGYAYLPAASPSCCPPRCRSITETTASGDLNAGHTVTLTLTCGASGDGQMQGGTPTLTAQ